MARTLSIPRPLLRAAIWPLEALALPFLALLCVVARCWPGREGIGIGPEPLINNRYHKQALALAGHPAESFVFDANFILSDFDTVARRRLPQSLYLFAPLWLFLRLIFKRKLWLGYFTGGPLYPLGLLAKHEPWLMKLAGLKLLLLPYGSDVQAMVRSPNLLFKHAMSQDYPGVCAQHEAIAQRVDRWLAHADWALSGCEWVDYMPRWDALMSGHFSIDSAAWAAAKDAPLPGSHKGPLRILHAPNHRAIKGTAAFLAACELVKAEGHELEVVLLQGVPNDRIREVMQGVDVVADQFVIGWYAMFAIEAMAMGKAVLCHVREDLESFYVQAGVLAPGELPLLPTPIDGIAQRLRWLCTHREALPELGQRGVAFVARHHSLERMAAVFGGALAQLGINPSLPVSVPPDPLAGWPGALGPKEKVTQPLPTAPLHAKEP